MRRKLIRIGAAILGVVLTVGVLSVIGYRTFAAHDSLTAPSTRYPATGPIFDERPFSELRAAPLVVDGRLRVYAEKWRVWSDGPVGARYEGTPYWVLRRWPAQVIGVVTAGSPTGPLVVTQWSDGALIAMGARTGDVSWRTEIQVDQDRYTGRRTGAATVYEPVELLTAVTRSGLTVVITTGGGVLRGFNGATGVPLWQHSEPDCAHAPAPWTAPALVALPQCDPTRVVFIDARNGSDVRTVRTPQAATPDACALGRSGCRLVRAGDRAYLADSPANAPEPLPGLPADAMLSGDRMVYHDESGIVSRPLRGDGPEWTWRGQGHLIAADSDGIYLLTDDLTMLGLDPRSGLLRVVGCAASLPGEHWQLGHVYPASGGEYVALERLSGADTSHSDQAYYYAVRPVALVELYPRRMLPIWPAKFAACRPL